MIYLHYEDAMQVFDKGCEYAQALIAKVNLYLISDEQTRSDCRPCFPFDMCYFFDSLIKVVGRFLGEPLKSGLDNVGKITPVRIPILLESNWRTFDFVKCGLAEAYIGEVCKKEEAIGKKFDVYFACMVASKAIDKVFISRLKNHDISYDPNPDFDTWLAGFNKLD